MSVFLTRISSFLQYNRHLGNLLHVKGQLCAFTFFNTLFIHYLTFRGFCWVFLSFSLTYPFFDFVDIVHARQSMQASLLSLKRNINFVDIAHARQSMQASLLSLKHYFGFAEITSARQSKIKTSFSFVLCSLIRTFAGTNEINS